MSHALHLLEDALGALLQTLQPNQQSDEARRTVVAAMQQLVGQALPPEYHCSLETFGSYRAGLHLPGSDLDFALAGWVLGENDRQIELYEWNNLEQQYVLADLADALEQQGVVEGQVERVLHARVPVIKFKHKGTGLECDVSINRPECTFKADMQKLLGSLDRRYATLYRLVKAWAAAHGLNDAAANTLNSWSLGLLVAFYLQCGTQPAVLPPIWQLLEKEPPDVRQPRVLQLPNINSAALKRVYTKAATGAGAYLGRRAREGEAAINSQTIGQLLAGFFQFYAPVLGDWAQGRNSSWRASTWWGDWKEAGWPGGKNYIFCIEDPFNAGDNTARAVGTHSHLSSCRTASYIAATVAASHQQLQRALSSSSSSSSSSSEGSPRGTPAEQHVLSAFAWLFGPHAVLQLGVMPSPLASQLQQQLPAELCMKLKQQLEALQDSMSLLACSSGLVNKDNASVSKDPERCELIAQALEVFRQLLRGLGCGEGQERHVCLGDFLAHRRVIEQREAEERERQRQEMLRVHEERRRREALLQQQQALQDGSTGSGDWGEEMAALQQQQQLPAVLAAMQGLHVGSGSSGGGSSSSNPRQSRPRRSGSGQQQQEQQGVQQSRQQQQGSSARGGGSSGGGGNSGRASRDQGRRQGSAPAHLQAAQASAEDWQRWQQALQPAAHSAPHSTPHSASVGSALDVAQQRAQHTAAHSARHSASFTSGVGVAQQPALQPAAHSAPHSASFSSGLELMQARARHEASSSSGRVAPGVQAVERVVGSRLAASALAGLGAPGKEPARVANGYKFRRHVQTEQQ